MTRFKSHQVNLDKTPFVDESGNRYRGQSSDPADLYAYDPHPEFQPTRDPYPYLVDPASTWPEIAPFRVRTRGEAEAITYRENFDVTVTWAPRREQFDTPVNRILIDVRYERDGLTNPVALVTYYSAWEQSIGDPTALGYWTADEIEHARKVLDRLAGWSA